MAAVASLVSGRQSLAYTIGQGGAWGLGHTITLFAFGAVVISVNGTMPENLARGLETAVGVMLVLLGADVLRRVIRDRAHFHVHRHADGNKHFHAHSRAGESRAQHDGSRHDHRHPRGFPQRALMVGLMHGMAGSAAVVLLALQSIGSPLQGMLYILVFATGSLLGMVLLSVVISIPMRMCARRLSWAHNVFQVLLGVLTIGLGLLVVYENGAMLNLESPVDCYS